MKNSIERTLLAIAIAAVLGITRLNGQNTNLPGTRSLGRPAAAPVGAVLVSSNGLILTPTNFWSANISTITGAVASAVTAVLPSAAIPGGNLTGDVTVPAGKGLFGDASTAALPLPPSANANGSQLPPLAITMAWDIGYNPTPAAITNLVTKVLTNGMYAAGYRIMWFDDGWQAASRSGGHLAASTNFPGGLKPIFNYFSSVGMTGGIYTSFAEVTCAGFPGTTYDKVDMDVLDFASWGARAIKVDACGTYPSVTAKYQRRLAQKFGNAIQDKYLASGYAFTNIYPMLLLTTLPRTGPQVANPWLDEAQDWLPLTSVNIWEDGNGNYDAIPSVSNAVFAAVSLSHDGWAICPGHYTEINGFSPVNPFFNTWTTNVCKAFMSSAAILSAAIITGGQQNTNVSYFTNTEVLAINQDPAVVCGTLVYSNNLTFVMNKPLGSRTAPQTNVLYLANLNGTSSNIVVNWGQLGIASNTPVMVRNVWQGTDLGLATNSYTYTMPATDVELLSFRKQNQWIEGSVTIVDRRNGANDRIDLGSFANGQPAIYMDSVGHGSDYALAGGFNQPTILNGPDGSAYMGFAFHNDLKGLVYRSGGWVLGGNPGVDPGSGNLLVNGMLQIGGTAQIKLLSGSGAPSVAAPVGSLYVRTDGGANTTLYVKESGTGTSGWVAK